HPHTFDAPAPWSMIPSAWAARGTRKSICGALGIESDQSHISILHDVLFSFAAHLPGRTRRLLAAAGDVIVIPNCLRANEAAFKIAVNLSGGLRCGLTAMQCPGSRFLRPGRKKRLEIEKLVRRAHERN